MSHEKAQKAQKLERDNNGTGLIEKLLRTDDQSEDINKLCDIVRETSFQSKSSYLAGILKRFMKALLLID